MNIRAATADDLPRIVDIYNHYVTTTAVTFDIEPHTVESRRRWFEQFAPTGPHRLLVAESAGGVHGYACSAQFRPRAAYRTSVSTSIYLDPASTGAGIGKLLYGALLDSIAQEGLHRVYAGITLPNDRSCRLHEAFGFRYLCTYEECGFKLGKYWNVATYEKPL